MEKKGKSPYRWLLLIPAALLLDLWAVWNVHTLFADGEALRTVYGVAGFLMLAMTLAVISAAAGLTLKEMKARKRRARDAEEKKEQKEQIEK